MQTMVERIASTVRQMHGQPDQSWEVFSDTAYAVIRDMREPTPAMIAAGEGKSCGEAWAAMLDAALSVHVDLDAHDAVEGASRHADDDDSGPLDPLFSSGS